VKRWETTPIRIPREVYTAKPEKTKTFESQLDYRPFRMSTVRHRLLPSAEGWDQVKRQLRRTDTFRDLAISTFHIYLADGKPVGFSVFVENLLRGVNIEIIYPAQSLTERANVPESIPEAAFEALKCRNWSMLMENTLSNPHLLADNPFSGTMAYMQSQALHGYAKFQLGDTEGALATYHDLQQQMNADVPNFKRCCVSVALEFLIEQAEYGHKKISQEIADAERQLYSGLLGDLVKVESEEDETCSVCLDDDYRATISTPCKHRYCPDCCKKWFFLYCKRTCPLCQQDVSQLTREDGTVINL